MSHETDPRIMCPNQNNAVCEFRQRAVELYECAAEQVDSYDAGTTQSDKAKLATVLAMHEGASTDVICHEAIGGCPVALRTNNQARRIARVVLD